MVAMSVEKNIHLQGGTNGRRCQNANMARNINLFCNRIDQSGALSDCVEIDDQGLARNLAKDLPNQSREEIKVDLFPDFNKTDAG
jgi:hypothetical protein